MTDEDAAGLKPGERVRLLTTAGTVKCVTTHGVSIQWDDWPFYPDFHPLPYGLLAVHKLS